MERPVHHVICREDHNRLDITIGIVAFLIVGQKFLVVVRAVDIQTTVVF